MDINPMYSVQPPISIPGYSNANYSVSKVGNYIQSLANQGSNLSGVNSYVNGTGAQNSAYAGGVYSPTQNRIYFVPFAQGNQANWHYIDCVTGTIVPYAAGVGAVANAYFGGAYCPTQNRVYFAPHTQGSADWHYIDCNTPTPSVITFTSPGGLAATSAYTGAVYSPTQNRVYFMPANQCAAANTNWHYIDCSTTIPTVVSYPNPGGLIALAYAGGVYSPTQNRVYFVPNLQCDPIYTNWHYIDCSATGSTVTLGTYPNPGNAITYHYGAYSPTQNRIYFCPRTQSAPGVLIWHYINCNTGAVETYPSPGNTVTIAYRGAVYCPTQNRIYFCPRDQITLSGPLHYIDCNTGLVGSYTNNATILTDAFAGGVYSPTENRVYFVPYKQQSNWFFLDMQSNANTSKIMMSAAEYNKL